MIFKKADLHSFILSNQKNFYWLILGLCLVSVLSLLYDGGMTYDEEVDYIGLRDQLSFALWNCEKITASND